jgi:hypothetical protein
LLDEVCAHGCKTCCSSAVWPLPVRCSSVGVYTYMPEVVP